jgi:hypothetical protein
MEICAADHALRCPMDRPSARVIHQEFLATLRGR